MKVINKPIQLAVVLVLVVGAIWYLGSQTPETSDDDIEVLNVNTERGEEGESRIALKEKRFERAKEITSPDHFINTEAFELKDLIGEKVILIDFWTYSCINCQRTTPYLNAWHDQYADDGLVIVGIHTPEFDFEKVVANVEDAVKDLGIEFPVVMDNDFSTWRAYRNRFWPRKYLIDIDGFIVYDHIGEGAYEETEAKIRELLEERNAVLGMETELDDRVDVNVDAPSSGQSPEVYFGSGRNELLANGIPGQSGTQIFNKLEEFGLNKLYLYGDWDIRDEFAKLESDEGGVNFRFKGKKVFFVGSADEPVRVQVLIDGEAAGEFAGDDVDEEGFITVDSEKLYKAFDAEEFGEHLLELRSEGSGLNIFTFTFG